MSPGKRPDGVPSLDGDPWTVDGWRRAPPPPDRPLHPLDGFSLECDFLD